MKKGKKLLALLVGVLMIATLTIGLAACGGSSDGLIKVCIINLPSNESGYRSANVQIMQNTFTRANGYDASFVNTMNNDEQIANFRRAVTNGVDYILLSAAATTGWTTAMNEAETAGIPVILFDRENGTENYTAAVVSDMEAEGTMAVNWLLDYADEHDIEELNVIHIKGQATSAASQGRTKALVEEAAKPGSKVNIVRTGTGGDTWSADLAKGIVEAAVAAEEDFNVIYAENDGMAAGAIEGLSAGTTFGFDLTTKAPKDVIIMSFDFNTWALNELLAGKWNYNGQCNPRQATIIDEIIQEIESEKVLPGAAGSTWANKKIINVEIFADAKNITSSFVTAYGI